MYLIAVLLMLSVYIVLIERVAGKGVFGGMTLEQDYDFTKYSTTGGTFTVSQWTGAYFQQLADVTTSAKAGVAIHITPTPAES